MANGCSGLRQGGRRFLLFKNEKKKNFDHKSQFQYIMICNVG